MKKIFLIICIAVSSFSFSETTDSLFYYKDKVSELEDKAKVSEMRIEKLQTMLIASCVSSVFVIGFCFYVLNKKKQQQKKP